MNSMSEKGRLVNSLCLLRSGMREKLADWSGVEEPPHLLFL